MYREKKPIFIMLLYILRMTPSTGSLHKVSIHGQNSATDSTWAEKHFYCIKLTVWQKINLQTKGWLSTVEFFWNAILLKQISPQNITEASRGKYDRPRSFLAYCESAKSRNTPLDNLFVLNWGVSRWITFMYRIWKFSKKKFATRGFLNIVWGTLFDKTI